MAVNNSKRRQNALKQAFYRKVTRFLLGAAAVGLIFFWTGDGTFWNRKTLVQEVNAAGELESNVAKLDQWEKKEPTDFQLLYRQEQERIAKEQADAAYEEWYQKHSPKSQWLKDKILSIDVSQYEREFMRPYMVGVAFSGDSMTTGLYEYFFLDESQVFGKIGGFLYESDPYIDRMIQYNPSVVCMFWGQNDIENYISDVDGFINEYREKLVRIQQALPNARIYVNAITHPKDPDYNVEPCFMYVDLYNERIEQLAQELGIEYMDMNFILQARPDFYCSDNVHVEIGFYKMWLIYMTQLAELGYEIE